MKTNYFIIPFFLAIICVACYDRQGELVVPEPPYSEMVGASEVTSNSAIFTLKTLFPVTANANGEFVMEDKYLVGYGFFYTTDPNKAVKNWNLAQGSIEDPTGTYSLKVLNLSPATNYYVRSWVQTANEQGQLNVVLVPSENSVEFVTLN